MKTFVVIPIILFFMSFSSFSQTLTLENETALPCHYALVDIDASGFPSNVAAITLNIIIDGDVVQCTGIQQPTIPGLFINQQGYNTISISWSNLAGWPINGRMVTLVLHYNGGYSNLQWDQGTAEIVLTDYSEIYPTYIDGSVSPGSYTFNTYFVDAAQESSGDGLSWENAFKTITEAANLSLKPGEQVLIKPGIYNEKLTIKSDGGVAVWPQTGVILSDTNKISFPSGANLNCVDLVSYPDQYYAYVYRSWNSNNGYYKIIEVDDEENFVRVADASFIPETGIAGNREKVMAAVGRPVIYKKDPASSDDQRVVLSANDLGSIADVLYIGKVIGDGQTDADSCNFNIVEGIDITGAVDGKGLHIQCSAYNTYARGKIYNSNGTGVIITGNSARKAKYNLIQDNEIYNTPYTGILLGYPSSPASNQHSIFNHVVDNDIYLSGGGALARFDYAVRIPLNNKSNVVEGNYIHDINLFSVDKAAVFVEKLTDNTLLYNNIIKNIGRLNAGTHACIMVHDTISKFFAYNNIIYHDDTVANEVYAFHLNGIRHHGSQVCYNTIYKIPNAFYLEDSLSRNIDFGIHNNIVVPNVGYFTHAGNAAGRFNVTYNLFHSGSIGPYYGAGTGQIFGDPVFVEPDGPSAYGLMLHPDSPCLGAGLAMSDISTDHLYISRDPSSPTMGAFEQPLTEIIWTGNNNVNWHDYLNWQSFIVPKSYMNVRIPNTTNDPVISGGNVTIKSLKLSPSAQIKVNSPHTFTLTD